MKWTNGQPTGKPAVLALVTQKVPKDELTPAEMVPAKINEVPTDVLAIGEPFADQAEPEVVIEALARKARPAEGGYSVAHRNVTAGTLATCVYDSGLAIPDHYYILSNNHVLANSNAASPGDPILQPGPADGGVDPSDRIARLSRWVRIRFEPPVPRTQHNNLVDAAIAEGQFHDLDREIYWIGYVGGWLRRREVRVGMPIHKTGRTTSYTKGRVTAVNATVDVGFGGGRVARFRDQIVTTRISAPGDSGSLVLTQDGNKALGLLFAGSPFATILNQIEHVKRLLGIEIV